MFLRAHKRLKDGKEHRYWSIVENRRVRGHRVVQRQVLYLGEINDSQRAAWCRTLEVFDEEQDQYTQLAIFPEDCQTPDLACEVVQIRLRDLQLRRPRQWGACWLACQLWDQLALDDGGVFNLDIIWILPIIKAMNTGTLRGAWVFTIQLL